MHTREIASWRQAAHRCQMRKHLARCWCRKRPRHLAASSALRLTDSTAKARHSRSRISSSISRRPESIARALRVAASRVARSYLALRVVDGAVGTAHTQGGRWGSGGIRNACGIGSERGTVHGTCASESESESESHICTAYHPFQLKKTLVVSASAYRPSIILPIWLIRLRWYLRVHMHVHT